MGEIYRAPDYLELPEIDYKNFNFEEYDKKENEYLRKVQNWARTNGRGKYAGKLIKFGVADGYAMYVVFSLKPVRLIHLDLGDGYEFEYAHRLSANDVKDLADRQDLFECFFKSKKSVKGA